MTVRTIPATPAGTYTIVFQVCPTPGCSMGPDIRNAQPIETKSWTVPGRSPSLDARPLARSWEGIARIRALGSQPPPPPPGWRGAPEKAYPRLVICHSLIDAFPPHFGSDRVP